MVTKQKERGVFSELFCIYIRIYLDIDDLMPFLIAKQNTKSYMVNESIIYSFSSCFLFTWQTIYFQLRIVLYHTGVKRIFFQKPRLPLMSFRRIRLNALLQTL